MSTLNIPMPREQLERLVRQVVRERGAAGLAEGGVRPAIAFESNLVVNTSARHMHVTAEDLGRLFGPGAELTVYRWLYQPGAFAAEERVTIMGPRRRTIPNVRILGPLRDYTQVEIAFTDAVALGLEVPVRRSGQSAGTPGCYVFGPAGMIELPAGVIRAERHVHMSPGEAERHGFHDKQYVKLRVDSPAGVTFDRVLCRVDPRCLLEVHLDTDEANACDLIEARGVELLA